MADAPTPRARAPDRRDRFAAWVRRAFADPKDYAVAVGVDLRTARSRFEGCYPPPDEEDRLIALHGEDFLAPVIFPALAAWVHRQETEAREAKARLDLARARLARAHCSLGKNHDQPENPAN